MTSFPKAKPRSSLAPFRARFARALSCLGLLGLLWTSSCDNPACVFGGTCSDDDPLGSGPAATVPANHAWVSTAAPKIEAVFPSGGSRAKTTPVVVRFSESMAVSSLTGSTFALVQQGGFGNPTLFLPPVLLGDGRLFVLIPAQPLTAGATYNLSLAKDKVVLDLAGQQLTQAAEQTLVSFTVAETDPALPAVVASWPPDGSSKQSATEEIAVVFDRRLLAASVNSDSFDVTIDGAQPPFDPPASPAVLIGAGSFPSADTRVWRWRSVDGAGEAQPLGIGSQVVVHLSPTGDKILAEGGGALPSIEIDHQLLSFPAPQAAFLASQPSDAIGIANLNGTVPLAVDVLVGSVLATDVIDVFLFGQTKSDPPQLAALSRQVQIADVTYDPGTGVATLGEAELNLAPAGTPLSSFFADGNLTIGLRLRRANVGGPLRLLDADPDQPGTQTARLDVTPPKLVGFGSTGTNLKSFSSDLRDLCLVGRASEKLRAVEVTTGLGSNGTQPSVVASDGTTFVAAPVSLGVVDPTQLPLPFSVRIYDAALNAALADTNARFEQVGVSGPGAALPGNATFALQLVDARTLAALAGADVFVHQDQSGVITPIDAKITDAAGRVVALAAPTGETIVTVQATGYTTLTLHGVPTARLSLTLQRHNQVPFLAAGVLSSSDSDIGIYDRRVVDSRSFPSDAWGVDVSSCGLNTVTGLFECAFGPRPVSGFAGVVSGLATDPPNSEFNYSATTFLRDFAWVAPTPLPVGTTLPLVSVQLGAPLDDADTSVEDRALDWLQATLDASSASGLDLNELEAQPRVLAQARARSLSGSAGVGAGVAFPQSGSPTNVWKLRSAISGRADPTDNKYPGDEIGDLVSDGAIDAQLRLFA